MRQRNDFKHGTGVYIVLICILLMMMNVSSVFASEGAQSCEHHQWSKEFCIFASDVEFNTLEIRELNKTGELKEEIIKRANIGAVVPGHSDDEATYDWIYHRGAQPEKGQPEVKSIQGLEKLVSISEQLTDGHITAGLVLHFSNENSDMDFSIDVLVNYEKEPDTPEKETDEINGQKPSGEGEPDVAADIVKKDDKTDLGDEEGKKVAAILSKMTYGKSKSTGKKSFVKKEKKLSQKSENIREPETANRQTADVIKPNAAGISGKSKIAGGADKVNKAETARTASKVKKYTGQRNTKSVVSQPEKKPTSVPVGKTADSILNNNLYIVTFGVSAVVILLLMISISKDLAAIRWFNNRKAGKFDKWQGK